MKLDYYFGKVPRIGWPRNVSSSRVKNSPVSVQPLVQGKAFSVRKENNSGCNALKALSSLSVCVIHKKMTAHRFFSATYDTF